MQRETTFRVGGALTIALGLALAAALAVTGAGIDFFDAWVGAALCIGLGVFFVYVARDEARTRSKFLEEAESSSAREPPGPGS